MNKTKVTGARISKTGKKTLIYGPEHPDYSKGFWLNAEWVSYEKTIDVPHEEVRVFKGLKAYRKWLEEK